MSDESIVYIGSERRNQQRLYRDLRATVRGVNAQRHGFETEAVVKNISASGLFMCMDEKPAIEAEMFLLVEFSTGRPQALPGAKVAIRGYPVRFELRADGSWCIGVRISHYRILSSEQSG